MQFVQDFSAVSSTSTTSRLFQFLVKEFVGGTPARIDACISAQGLMESIGVITYRTADENLLQALIGFAKMGNVLSLYTDADQNGVADAGVDLCLDGRGARATTAVAGNFFDKDLREFGTGLTLAISNMTALASTIQFGAGAFTAFSALPAATIAITDPTAFSTGDLQTMQTLLKESTTVGLGTACTGDVTVCHCP